MNVWWCNQSDQWETERPREVVCGGESRAPTFRRTVGDVRKGDITVHYLTRRGLVAISRARTDGRRFRRGQLKWRSDAGWFFRAEYHDLDPVIPLRAIQAGIAKLRLPKSPIERDGGVKQAYFIPFDLRGLVQIRLVSNERWLPWAEAAIRDERQRTRAVEAGARQLSDRGAFDPTDLQDARRRITRELALRQGQPAFRADLLRAYGPRCAISGADATDVLEAAHILPYRGPRTNHIQNGLLLRADLHVLFDRGLLTVDPGSYRIEIADALRNTCYANLSGKRLRVPLAPGDRPSRDALKQHRKMPVI